jgi:endonuclease YncB( thermonuclease family)
MGLVNTPELGECFGDLASRTRKELVADGFRAQVYETDRYGRGVSVITLADGRNLNVWMARHGYADDRYLAQYRSENPALAAQLDVAFAAAKRERAGLWGACRG